MGRWRAEFVLAATPQLPLVTAADAGAQRIWPSISCALPTMRWLSDWGMNQERFVPLRDPSYLSLAWPRDK
ncbi:hypothetical protein EAH75_15270 [Rhodanobacter glycinis]|uniref:Uncharacterized protein n=1 Tax=Rhodanobacter glycinis TaxID=582702 RepID=A0A502FBH0_9GAMM|nr:hypothetical protein EAH88_02210 [Rhodanobacter glycinis]TPG46788.1 hypothetical protein EAH75_15270 [Rhodanobacter glycinis]